jgi:hypothetical protein
MFIHTNLRRAVSAIAFFAKFQFAFRTVNISKCSGVKLVRRASSNHPAVLKKLSKRDVEAGIDNTSDAFPDSQGKVGRKMFQ